MTKSDFSARYTGPESESPWHGAKQFGLHIKHLQVFYHRCDLIISQNCNKAIINPLLNNQVLIDICRN